MIAGYCWPQSALPGDAVGLHVSTTSRSFDVEVVRQGARDDRVFARTDVTGVDHATPDDAASAGCRWPVAVQIDVGEWRSGFYLVRLTGDDGEQAEAFFVVRAAAASKRPLLVLSTSTWAAYNDWGGPSYYTGGHVSSLERPLPKGFLARPVHYSGVVTS